MNDPGIHAEACVIKKLRYLETKHKVKWEKIHIIVVRLKRSCSGEVSFSMSKPCVHCTSALQKTKISQISWSTENGTFDHCKVCELCSEHVSRKFRYSKI